MARSSTIKVSLYDSEEREVEITARYYPGSDAYFDKGFGNWLPGDPEDVEAMDARAVDEGANVAEVEANTDAIFEAVCVAAADAREDGRLGL